MRPLLVPLLFAVAVAGCSVLEPRTDPTRFYVLAATGDATAGPPTHLVLGLGPVVLPRYLQESTLVKRVGPNEVRFIEFSRWAGPLPMQFAGTLAEDLRELLDTDRIVPFPWYPDTPLDVAVAVDVLRFETDVDGQAHLVARWKVQDRAGAVLRSGDSDLAEPVVGEKTDVDAAVAALSRALGRLARDIADGVRAVHPAEGVPARKGRAKA